jgi:outer membrane protein assembly factor BamA
VRCLCLTAECLLQRLASQRALACAWCAGGRFLSWFGTVGRALRAAAAVSPSAVRAAALVLAGPTLIACAASVPKGRYSVAAFDLEGADRIDPAAVEACLATHERSRAGITLGANDDPQCGVPPFDSKRISIQLWAWPWTDRPLYDEAVFTRDLDRIERFYRARGHYAARVTGVQQKKDDEDREIELRVQVEENEPVLVDRIEVSGLDALSPRARQRVQAAQQLKIGEPFDEAIYDSSKEALTNELREHSYARAAVEGSVEIDPVGRKASVEYRVTTGPAYKFGRLEIEGEEDLPVRPIWGAADIREGKPFSPSTLDDAKRAIYELGPFASVDVVERPRANADVVDILIKVVPGRRLRWGVGAGMQVGNDGSISTNYISSDENYWDLHLLGKVEHRDFFGGMRRLSVEERPRLIFDDYFPRTPAPQLGNLLLIEFRQPAFVEPRTTLAATGRWDLGPDPYGGKFSRSDVVASVGPERTFFGGKLSWSSTLNVNLFIPQGSDAFQPYEAYYVTYMQHAFSLDLRNDARSPRRGAYFGFNIQHAGYFLPSDWNYVRLVPDARGYVPLPLGMVLAMRGRMGVMEITASRIKVPNAPEDDPQQQLIEGYRQRLHDVGPLRQRLRGGGSTSVRGYDSNTLGDVVRVGERLDSGGLRLWEASLELRVPLTTNFGAVLFSDVGDITREKRFRFSQLQTTFGFGLRYKTIVGPIRLDFGLAPSGLQSIGADERSREAYTDEGLPIPFPESHLFSAYGSVHFTIGEAF